MESSSQPASEKKYTNKQTKNTYTYSKLRWRLKKQRPTCWSNKSLHCVFFEVVRKCSGEISQQLPAEPTTERKTATFSTVILSKKKCVIRAVYIFFSSSLNPTGSFGGSDTEDTAPEAFYRGVWAGFFSKNVKNVKDFRRYVKAISYSSRVLKVKHPVATATRIGHLPLAMETRRSNVTSRHGINNKHLK